MTAPHKRSGAEFEPLPPSTLMRYTTMRVASVHGLIKMMGVNHLGSAVKDEVIDLQNLVLDHICHDPELYVDSARKALEIRDAMQPAPKEKP